MATLALVPRNFPFTLPGRTWQLVLCHPAAWCAGCDVCLRKIAAYLADEMEFVLAVAQERTVESYRAELGFEFCTEQQASDLRLMTCSACYRAGRLASDLTLSMFVADSPLITEADLPVWRGREARADKLPGVFWAVAGSLAVWAVIAGLAAVTLWFRGHHGR